MHHIYGMMHGNEIQSYTGDAPPRKRRRPALACDQCRRRKIRCDQKVPCDQCHRSKKSLSIHACTYTHAQTSAGPSSSSSARCCDSSQPQRPSALQAPPAPTVPIPQISRPGNFPSYPSPFTANESDQSTHADDQRSDVTGSIRNVAQDLQSAATIQALVDRVRLLEKKLAQSTSTSSVAASSSPGGRRLDALEDREALHTPVRGTFSKTRFFGQSHWMNCAKEFNMVYNLRHRLEVEDNSGISRMMDRCKTLARAIKVRRPTRQPAISDLTDLVPPRETADQLVSGYLLTFETVYRILHVPTFQQEYAQLWNPPQSASPAFVVRLLLVMALGTCFYKGPGSSITPRITAAPWIYAAQSWLGGPSEKSRVNIAAVQIHCLLLLARQSCAIDGDLVWISAGSLLRAAMYVGLHRDPQYLPKMPVFQAELRRRLWATVLELLLQSSMDAGGAPLVSLQDYDCESPSNIDDHDMNPDDPEAVPHVTNGFTHTSVQIALVKSFPIRLQMAKAMNDIRSEPSYDEVLRLSSKLTAIQRDSSLHLFNAAHHSQDRASQPSAFQTQSVSLLTNRFLLALHHPFAVKAKTNLKYYFSRKICLDAALQILSPNKGNHSQDNNENAAASTNSDDDDFDRLKLHAGGFIRSSAIYAQFTISLELIYQLQEDMPGYFLSTPASLSTTSSSATQTWRRELHTATDNYMRLAMARIRAGETNVKGYIFSACVLAQIKAMEAGVAEVEGPIMEAAKEALDQCYLWLKERAKLLGEREVEVSSEEDEGTGLDTHNTIYGERGDSAESETQRMEFADWGSQFLFDIPDSWLFSAIPSGDL
ncbi:C6 zinc finger domain-containing protein [Blastomyces dermatitidis ER-3]|uniref:C6 zinc finger domain-containing protein n=1 Tax=Ajellomyces dermatitidis (strain ER-3 / ATCC MYA-2586) TaxID=559297 RepID=A0ABM9YGU3_AJEDR|nr:C6 zinc finger domain-containing protein [Blastomyces dermatitidis ER-3]EEQ87416.2 C6 zinc finger domain-containing protein [Blastomyces dermatitidis ER-3]